MRTITLIALMITFLTAPVYARSMGIGGFYSLGIPIFEDTNWDTGYNESLGFSPVGFGARIYYKIIPLLSIDSLISYQRYNLTNSDTRIIPITLGIGGNMHISKFYFGGGLNVSYVTVKENGTPSETSESATYLGFFVNGGTTFSISDSLNLNIGAVFDAFARLGRNRSVDIKIRVGVDYVVF